VIYNVKKQGHPSTHDDFLIRIFSDIYIPPHDGVDIGIMNVGRFHVDENRLEQDFLTSKFVDIDQMEANDDQKRCKQIHKTQKWNSCLFFHNQT
jgi:hypothetical protein